MNKHSGLKKIGVLLCLLLCLLNMSQPARYLAELPDTLYITNDIKSDQIAKAPAPLTLSDELYTVQSSTDERILQKSGENVLRIRLGNLITLRRVDVQYRERIYVMPGGEAIGVTLYLPGALIVGLGAFLSVDGSMASPAQDAGLKAGDMILKVNGETVQNAAHLSMLCAQAKRELKLVISRNGEEKSIILLCVQAAEDRAWKLGMWVRDSTAGIGTLSFYDRESLRFGALGHPVTDVDTGSLLEIGDGGISAADVIGVSCGMQGMPGELHGAFSTRGQRIGEIESNTNNGIFGYLSEDLCPGLYPQGIPLAFTDEVVPGAAQILSTVDESGVRAFDCEIIRTFAQDSSENKSMILRVNDPELLAITGGIVQGMSGSPVIQNGRLAGVVTHVFVNDPTKGYAVYAEWMYNSMIST